jgi:hypothetical protein
MNDGIMISIENTQQLTMWRLITIPDYARDVFPV